MFASRRAQIATLVAAGVLGFGGVAAAGPAALELIDPSTGEEVAEEPVVEEPAPEEPVVEEPEVEEPEVEEPEVEEPEVEEPEVEEPVVDEPAPVELVDDVSTVFDETECLPGNHGKTVSAVARGLEIINPETGEPFSVRDAAHSSCGKTVTDDEDEVEEPEEETPEVEAPEVEEPEIEELQQQAPSGKPDHAGKQNGGGKDNGGGKGKGNGKGK